MSGGLRVHPDPDHQGVPHASWSPLLASQHHTALVVASPPNPPEHGEKPRRLLAPLKDRSDYLAHHDELTYRPSKKRRKIHRESEPYPADSTKNVDGIWLRSKESQLGSPGVNEDIKRSITRLGGWSRTFGSISASSLFINIRQGQSLSDDDVAMLQSLFDIDSDILNETLRQLLSLPKSNLRTELRTEQMTPNVAAMEACEIWCLRNPQRLPTIPEISGLAGLFKESTVAIKNWFTSRETSLNSRSAQIDSHQASEASANLSKGSEHMRKATGYTVGDHSTLVSRIVTSFKRNRKACCTKAGHWTSDRNQTYPRNLSRPFTCPSCGKTWRRKCDWKRHLEQANWVQKVWICAPCIEKFSSWYTRRVEFMKHRKQVHGDQPNAEPFCQSIPDNFESKCFLDNCREVSTSFQGMVKHYAKHMESDTEWEYRDIRVFDEENGVAEVDRSNESDDSECEDREATDSETDLSSQDDRDFFEIDASHVTNKPKHVRTAARPYFFNNIQPLHLPNGREEFNGRSSRNDADTHSMANSENSRLFTTSLCSLWFIANAGRGPAEFDYMFLHVICDDSYENIRSVMNMLLPESTSAVDQGEKRRSPAMELLSKATMEAFKAWRTHHPTGDVSNAIVAAMSYLFNTSFETLRRWATRETEAGPTSHISRQEEDDLMILHGSGQETHSVNENSVNVGSSHTTCGNSQSHWTRDPVSRLGCRKNLSGSSGPIEHYICLECGKTFSDAAAWRRHEFNNARPEEWECEFCSSKGPNSSRKSWARKDECKNHMKTAHCRDGESYSMRLVINTNRFKRKCPFRDCQSLAPFSNWDESVKHIQSCLKSKDWKYSDFCPPDEHRSRGGDSQSRELQLDPTYDLHEGLFNVYQSAIDIP